MKTTAQERNRPARQSTHMTAGCASSPPFCMVRPPRLTPCPRRSLEPHAISWYVIIMKGLSTSAADSFRGLLEILPDMCFVISADLKIVDCNQRARAVTGLPAQLDGSIPFTSLLTPDSARPPFDTLDEANCSCETEVRFRQDGRKAMDALVYVNGMSIDQERHYV
ncbi:MAG TPA: PAS domain-containing protein, partial [Bacteroidota bacterium]|nr:PAS domain-containing protein [Bacteroidota bacterium]